MHSKLTTGARKISGRLSVSLLAAALLLTIIAPLAALADDYSDAMAKFKSRDYAGASASFRKAIFDRPGDANCFYYYALSCHYAKDYNAAKIGYLEVIQRYPGTDAANRAQQGLNSIAPGLLASAASPSSAAHAAGGARSGGGSRQAVTTYSGGSSSSSGVSSGDIIPSQSVANFSMENGHMVMDVSFNGRRTRAIFDTGAEMILMGKNHLAEIGLPMPTGETIARSRGVGGKIEEVWGQRMDVTVGGVTRKNIMVHIQEHMDSLPLLGLPFVQGMNYAVESSAVRFSARNAVASAAAAARGTDYRTVPYTMQGRSMMVAVQINGRAVNMCFDTGANGTLFSKAQADAAGIRVPDDAEVMIGSGVGGSSLGRYVPINSIKLGPVEKRDMKVGIDFTSQLANPLLGKDFWGDHRYSVDQDSHVIRFE